jgi:DNA primase
MSDRPFIDFRAVRDASRILDVLNRYRVKLRRVSKVKLTATCPLPKHTSKDKNTFVVSEEKNVWYCHSSSCRKGTKRDGGNVIDLVMEMEGVPQYEAARMLMEWKPAIAGSVQDSVPACASVPASPPASPPEPSGKTVNKPLGFRLKMVDPSHPLIASKGVNAATAAEWGVGFYRSRQKTASMDDRIVFPLWECGEMVGYAGRTVLPVTDENPKWKMPVGLVKSFLYGLERCDPPKPLVIVEGCWEVLRFHQQGIQTASLLGSYMTAAQERCLDPFGTIWVMMDDDEKGRAASDGISARLRAKHRVLIARLKE